MKALKSFCTNKHLLLFNLAIKTPVSFSFSSRQNLVFPRHFHVTSLRFRVEDSSLAAIGSFSNEPDLSRSGHGNENSAGVGSVYNPVAGETFTRPCINRNGGQEFDPSSWSSGSWVDDFQRTRASGSVKKANASNRGNTNADTSDAYNWIDNFEGEETYGRVRGENLTAGDDIRLGSSSSDDGTNDLFKEKANKGVKKANSSSVSWHEFRLGGIVRNKKKVKEKVSWVCTECGHSEGQWWGSCRECNSVGTVKQFTEASESGDNGKVRGLEFSANAVRSWLPQQATDVQPRRLTDINRGVNQLEWRIPLSGYFGCEVARVLGGGLVPGSLVLIGGDPGVGKSTLLLQIAAIVAEGSDLGRPAPVLYVSGEESVEQIGNRADRMSITTEELFLYSSTDIEDILKKVQLISPRALIIDSIQTVYLKEVSGSAGGISQVKECTLALLCFAKKTNIPVLLVGHVTKSGEIAGPRALEHIVDAVLYMEGEENSSYRLLRPVKNRFGSTDELGVFEMSQLGLQAVSNPSEIFLSENHSDSEFLAGLAVAVIMDGSRSFLLEIQALCVSGSTVSRHVNGIQASRADMIISVLMKQAGLQLRESAVFLNVVSGVSLTETAGDLAIAAAICSSFLEFPIPNSVAFIGEIGLGGELRMVPRMEKRVSTVAKLGYKKCIIPKSAEKSLATMNFEDMEIVGCKNLKEVINAVFRQP